LSSNAIVFGMGLTLLLAMVSQLAALKLRVPGIVLLLPVGFVAGHFIPSVNLRATFGNAYTPMVSLAVAMILFDGGLELVIGDMKGHIRHVVRRLQTAGVALTAAGAMILSLLVLHLSWKAALMFGVMVVVSGPTVVAPLLDFARPGRNTSLVLSWEGTTIDAIGAILAAVVFQGFIHPHGRGVLSEIAAFLVSVMVGLAGAAVAIGILWLLLSKIGLRGKMATQVILMTVVGIAGLCDAIRSDTGLIAAVLAGVAFANLPQLKIPQDRRFFEAIVQLVIGVLFISIASSVTFGSVWSVLLPTIVVVLGLVLIVRPMVAALVTLRTDLRWQERVLIGWMHPRGIIAAATAASFGVGLSAVGIAGANKLLPAVFLVILGTVSIYGLTASSVAKLLGLQVSKEDQLKLDEHMPIPPTAVERDD
jgi:NhaP-type Na+/H+ or K+/H+ antiporter